MDELNFPDLRGRTLVITGITRGIGKALLKGLLDQGLRIIAISKGGEAMQAVRQELRADDSRMHIYECDLADPRQTGETALQILGEGHPVDGLLHNAAIDPRRSFEQSGDSFWNEVFQVNVFSSVSLTRLLLPVIRKSDQGRIIFTGSVAADLGVSLLSAYAASKGALTALTRSLAHELKGTGITVNCVQPGAIQVEKENHSAVDDARIIGWQAVQRRLQPEDLLGPVCMLLSRMGGGMTGQTLTVDGGLIHPLADFDAQAARSNEEVG